MGRRRAGVDTLAPDGSEIRLLVTSDHGATRASLVEVTLAAGGVSRPVWHQTVEEIWYVLEGRGHVWRSPPDIPDADASTVPRVPAVPAAPDAAAHSVPAVPVSPGDALVIPTRWRFQFSASPEGPLRFLCYTSPPWPGEHEAQPAPVAGLGPPTV